jgi:hypothetical protein
MFALSIYGDNKIQTLKISFSEEDSIFMIINCRTIGIEDNFESIKCSGELYSI